MMYEAGLGVHKDSPRSRSMAQESRQSRSCTCAIRPRRIVLPRPRCVSRLWAGPQFGFGKPEQNFAPAQYALGALCAQGRGVPQDNEEAISGSTLRQRANGCKNDGDRGENARTKQPLISHQSIFPAATGAGAEWFEDHPRR